MEEKPGEIFSQIIFPNNFIDKIKKWDNKKLMIECFNEDLVLAEQIISKEKSIIEDYLKLRIESIKDYCKIKFIHIDNYELKDHIKKIFYYHENGIFNPEDYFYFIKLSSPFRRTITGKERNNGISCRECEIKLNGKFNP